MDYKFYAASCRGKFRLSMSTSGQKIAEYHMRLIERGSHAGMRWKVTVDDRPVWKFKPVTCHIR